MSEVPSWCVRSDGSEGTDEPIVKKFHGICIRRQECRGSPAGLSCYSLPSLFHLEILPTHSGVAKKDTKENLMTVICSAYSKTFSKLWLRKTRWNPSHRCTEVAGSQFSFLLQWLTLIFSVFSALFLLVISQYTHHSYYILVICKIRHKAPINIYLQVELIEKVCTYRLLKTKRRGAFPMWVSIKEWMEEIYFEERLWVLVIEFIDVEQAVQVEPSQMCPSLGQSILQPDIQTAVPSRQ